MTFGKWRTDNFKEFRTIVGFYILRKRWVEQGDTLGPDPLSLGLGVGFLLLVHQLVAVPGLIQSLLVLGGDRFEYIFVWQQQGNSLFYWERYVLLHTMWKVALEIHIEDCVVGFGVWFVCTCWQIQFNIKKNSTTFKFTIIVTSYPSSLKILNISCFTFSFSLFVSLVTAGFDPQVLEAHEQVQPNYIALFSPIRAPHDDVEQRFSFLSPDLSFMIQEGLGWVK